MQLNYTLLKPKKARKNASELEPVLDQYIPTTVTVLGHIQKRCGKNRFCIPDLVVSAYSPVQVYTLGNEKELDLQVTVINRGEDAFEAVVRVFIPSDVDYINVININAQNPVDCVQPDTSIDGDIVCDIGNPLPANHTVIFTVRTSASKASGIQPSLQFTVSANSSNEENSSTTVNNVAIVNIPVKAVVSITLTGVSHPEHILANASWKAASDFANETVIGPEVVHLYEITNFGPSQVASMRTFIQWPLSLSDGSYLLYLLETPRVIRGEGQCWTDNANPLNITLENQPVNGAVLEQLTRTARLRSRTVRQTAEQLVGQISCGEEMPGCAIIRCETGSMEGKDDSVLIQIRSRVYTNTLIQKQARFSGFRARSKAVTSVLSLPYNVHYEVNAVDTHEVETFVALVSARPTRRFIDWVIIALSIIGGCLLLFIIVAILWKLGFFERKKVEDHPPLYQAVKKNEDEQ
jgi:hypothetical protein